MNHFYVLRNNREAGPFTRAELKAYGLLSTDLLWVDGESKEWKHPAEIDGLEMAFSEGPKQESAAVETAPAIGLQNKPFAGQILSPDPAFTAPPDPALHNDPADATVFQRKRSHAPAYTIGAQLFGVVVVLIGLSLCAFVAINLVKQFAAKPATTSEAVLINAETLPASNTAHAAQAPTATPLLLAAVVEKKDTTVQKENLLQKTLKTLAGGKTIKTKSPSTTTDKPQTAGSDENKEAAPDEPVVEKPKPVKPATPPVLQLSVNEYKVGLFGGVSNLEITVANPSGQSISKAIVEIEYLKPNGNVVKTQTVTAEGIAAGASKTIPVPSSGRGVKVRYHVVNVE